MLQIATFKRFFLQGNWMGGIPVAIFIYTQLYVLCDIGEELNAAVKIDHIWKFATNIISFNFYSEWKTFTEITWDTLVFNVKAMSTRLCSRSQSTTKRCLYSYGPVFWTQLSDILDCKCRKSSMILDSK